MDCNKEEALRARDIADRKMESRDFSGARKFALKAQQLNPDLENLAQMLIVCDVHCSSQQKLFGNEMDWYGILQLEQTANDAIIKKQYRKFALQLHPDKNKFSGAEAAFKLIGEAQRVLLDKEKRSQYDMKCRVQVNKTAVPRRNQQTTQMNSQRATQMNSQRATQMNSQRTTQMNNQRATQMNSSSAARTNVRHNTNLNHQQQWSRKTAQEGPNGRGTFWTVCPFCSCKYQYYKTALNRSLLCHQCHQPFIAFDVDMQSTSPANNSCQPAFSGLKDDLNHVTFKAGVRAQGNLHAEKSNTEHYEKKGPADVPGKTNGKRKRKKEEESCGSFNSIDSTGSEENDDVFLRPSKRFQVNSSSNVKSHPNVYICVDAEFSDFEMEKRKECFVAGQIWAFYDTTDGMPRFYALIRKVLFPGFKLQITWLEPHVDGDNENRWVNEDLPVACGKYKLGNTDITEDHLMFSHLVFSEKIGRNTFKIYPRKGETWALFKNWDIKWYMDKESHQQYEFEFVEILSDYIEGVGVFVTYLFKLKGFVSLFCKRAKENNYSFQIPPTELFRFSHRVPSFRMNGQEGVNVHVGSFELSPACLPLNLEEIAVPEKLDVKVGHGSSGGEKTIYLNRSKPLVTSVGDASKVNLEKNNLAEENKDSLNHHAPRASTSEPIEMTDFQFFDFEGGSSLEKFHVGQIWAFYSDEDGLPRYYGQISRIQTSPDVELHVTWLTCCWLPEGTIRWEDEDMPISCGRFKVNKTVERANVYCNTSAVSHQVHAEPVGKSKHYPIFPSKGEVWALYRNWSNKIKCSDLKNHEYDIVEVLGGNDLWIEVLVLEVTSGFGSVFQGQSDDGPAVYLKIPRKELLRFSHQIHAFKLTEEHGNLRGFWKVDPGALPGHFGSK